MAIVSFKTIIVPKMKVMTSESKFGVFHNILAKSLEEWFNKILSLQLMSADGTITSPAGTITPFVVTGLRADIMKIRFNQYRIKNCVKNGGDQFFKNLFEYIGIELSKQLKIWSTNPTSSKNKVPNPINVLGTTENPMVTTHFKFYGIKCRIEMSSKDPEGENITKDLWDTFEKYLKSAINKIPVMPINVSGSTPGGVFNGVAQIKMKV